jgi:hypothetical protein
MAYVIECCELLQHLAVGMLACLFAFAGIMKLATREEFRDGLRILPYVGRRRSTVLSWFLPLVEIGIAGGLWLGETGAAFAAILLLVMFVAVAAYAIHKRLRIPCNCFGGRSGELSVGTIKRNVLLIALATSAVLVPPGSLSPFELTFSATLLVLSLSVRHFFQNRRVVEGLVGVQGLRTL